MKKLIAVFLCTSALLTASAFADGHKMSGKKMNCDTFVKNIDDEIKTVQKKAKKNRGSRTSSVN